MEASVLDKNRAMGSQQEIWLKPPAKINLSLVVFGRRPDGFHDLHTVMATIGLHDDLNISRSENKGIDLRCTGQPAPAQKENLVYRAANLLAQSAGITPALSIRLHKRIPAGAGLGGASSNAAACLLGLNQLWDLHLSRTQLSELAAQLGSDVPFFLHAPVALCTGRGEQVKPLPHRCRRSIVLILTKMCTPTADVYQNYAYNQKRSQDYMRRVNYFLRRGDLDGLIIQQINSLQNSCMDLFQPLQKLQKQIQNLGIGPLQISGSGSSLFTSCPTSKEAEGWARKIQKNNLAQVYALNFFDQTDPLLEEHHADI